MASLVLLLRLNAASCLVFGSLFVFFPSAVASVLGAAPSGVIFGLGVLLLINGVHLALSSFRSRPIPAEILWFSLGDLLWWLGSLALIAAGLWIVTPAGAALTMVVAFGVASLGVLQLLVLGQRASKLSMSEHWRRIGHSWMALPGWVKIWLFALNIAFLAAPAMMPWEAARVILIAYVASGPMLLGFAVHAGGLTRAMGVGHIVPWVPLLVWMVVQFPQFGEAGPLAQVYAAKLGAMVVLCLAFDIYDLVRWHRGEQAILLKS